MDLCNSSNLCTPRLCAEELEALAEEADKHADHVMNETEREDSKYGQGEKANGYHLIFKNETRDEVA